MARNIGVKQLGNTLKPLADSRVQISPPHHLDQSSNVKALHKIFFHILVFDKFTFR